MSSLKGRKNGYTCRGCGWRIVTVDQDEGVTPFLIGCQNDVASEEDKAKGREASQGVQYQRRRHEPR